MILKETRGNYSKRFSPYIRSDSNNNICNVTSKQLYIGCFYGFSSCL